MIRFATRTDFLDHQRRALAAMAADPAPSTKAATRRVPHEGQIRLYRFDETEGCIVKAGTFRTLAKAEERAREISIRFNVELRDDAQPMRLRLRQSWAKGRKVFDRAELS